jgi:hypothetical protein
LWIKTFLSLLSNTTTAARRTYKVFCPGCPSISEIPLLGSFEKTLAGQYAVCILVEKGRMGDTIPNISFFDLRARYSSTVLSSHDVEVRQEAKEEAQGNGAAANREHHQNHVGSGSSSCLDQGQDPNQETQSPKTSNVISQTLHDPQTPSSRNSPSREATQPSLSKHASSQSPLEPLITSKHKHSFSSFLQDVGRCFGYHSSPPTILLNQGGHLLFLGQTHLLDKFLDCTPDLVRLALNSKGTNEGGGLHDALGPLESHSDPLEEAQKNKYAKSGFLPNKKSMYYPLVSLEQGRVNEADMERGEKDPDLLQKKNIQTKEERIADHMRHNQILFLARPQIGKTGAFIRLIELVLNDKK